MCTTIPWDINYATPNLLADNGPSILNSLLSMGVLGTSI